MFKLKNDQLEIEINAFGAELTSIKKGGINYLWDGNPEFWGRTSPVLFPIIGAVAEGKYFVEGKVFQLDQHGFARDMDFEVVSQTEDEIWFSIRSTDVTRKRYPFDFKLHIGYVLDGDTVRVKWKVVNCSDVMMPFSIGGHPGFATEPDLSDYYLQFKKGPGIETYVFDDEYGLVDLDAGKVTIVDDLKLLPLSKDLFEDFPTLILEGETGITLRSYSHDYEIEIGFEGFPYVGIWSPTNSVGEIAPFVCIEPWFGMADTKYEPGDIYQKKGIQILDPGATFEASYTMTFR